MLCGKNVTICYHSTIHGCLPKTSRCIYGLFTNNHTHTFMVCGKIITIEDKMRLDQNVPKNGSVRVYFESSGHMWPFHAQGGLGGFFTKLLWHIHIWTILKCPNPKSTRKFSKKISLTDILQSTTVLQFSYQVWCVFLQQCLASCYKCCGTVLSSLQIQLVPESQPSHPVL